MKTKRNQTGGQCGERVGRQEFWRWLAAIALVVLVIEWLVISAMASRICGSAGARRAGAG